MGLELEADLGGEGSASGFRVDLTEGAGIDVQVGISRSRMVEDIVGIHTEREAPGFRNLDSLLNVRIDVPASGAVDGVEAQRAQLAGGGILQDDLAAGVRNSGVGAEQSSGSAATLAHAGSVTLWYPWEK